MQIEKFSQLIEATLDANKGFDIRVIDVSELTSVTDRMIIVTGRSDRHNRSLADKVMQAAKENGITPLGIEGNDAGQGDWVLVDLADVIVHVMVQDARDFYNLEALWSRPKKVENSALDYEIESEAVKSESV